MLVVLRVTELNDDLLPTITTSEAGEARRKARYMVVLPRTARLGYDAPPAYPTTPSVKLDTHWSLVWLVSPIV